MPVAVEGADRLHRRERAREKDAKKDELARPGLNLDLRNGCLMGSMPAVSVLIPEAFRPINHLIPAVTPSNGTSLAIYTPQHPQKGRASSSCIARTYS